MYEGKLQEIFAQNDSKYHSASMNLDKLNQDQRDLLKKKIASRCRIASGLSEPLEVKGKWSND